MEPIILNKLNKLKNKYIKIKKIINIYKINNNKLNLNKLLKKYKNLKKINNYYSQWIFINKEINSIKKNLKNKNNFDFKKKFFDLNNLIKKKEKKIKLLLIIKNNKNNKNCFLEIKAGTGGNEATLFARSLFRMYNSFAEKQLWKIKIINIINSNNGGYKEIIIKIYNKNAYEKLKFESGGHRVQRIPKNENKGRIHTSTCIVAVTKEIKNIKLFKINSNDLRIDTFRSSGSGGQHVNTTNSAIRITHLPTKITVECQDERSQHKNKNKALTILKSKIKF